MSEQPLSGQIGAHISTMKRPSYGRMNTWYERALSLETENKGLRERLDEQRKLTGVFSLVADVQAREIDELLRESQAKG